MTTPTRTYLLPTDEELPFLLSSKGYYHHHRVLDAKDPREKFLKCSKKKPIYMIFLVVYGLTEYSKFQVIVDDIVDGCPEVWDDDALYRYLEEVFATSVSATKQVISQMLECEGLRLEKLSFLYPHVHKWRGSCRQTENYMEAYYCLRDNGVPIPDNYMELLRKHTGPHESESSVLILNDLAIQQ